MITVIPNPVTYKIQCDKCKITFIETLSGSIDPKPPNWEYVDVVWGTGHYDHGKELVCHRCLEKKKNKP